MNIEELERLTSVVQAHSRPQLFPAQNRCPRHQPRNLRLSQMKTQVRLATPSASRLKVLKSPHPLKSPRSTNTSRSPPYKHPSLPLALLPSTKILLSNAQNIKLPEVVNKADLYYGYVPLANGDMIPPVEAVYRPHGLLRAMEEPSLKFLHHSSSSASLHLIISR